MFYRPTRHPIRETGVVNSTTGSASAMLDHLDLLVETVRELQWLVATLAGSIGSDGVVATARVNGLNSGLVSATNPETLTVAVYGGVFIVDDYPFRITSDYVTPAFDVPSVDDRIDLIVAAPTGSLPGVVANSFVIIQGEESPTPVAPAVPDGTVSLAQVYCRSTMTAVYNEDLSPATEGYIIVTRNVVNA